MAERRRPRKPGRRLKLDKRVEDRLVQLTRAAVPVDQAAAAVGVSRSTFLSWLQIGREEQEWRDQLEEGLAEGTPDRELEPFVRLWQRIYQARAEAASNAVLNVQRVAAGGAVLEEVTRKYRDPVTGQIVEETTVKRQAPDWRAAAFVLERQFPQHFGKDNTMQVELTGAGGGAVQVQTSVDADSLGEKVAANIAAAQAAMAALPSATRELTAGDDDAAVDAEVIDE